MGYSSYLADINNMTITLMTHEGENSFIYKSRAGKPTVLTVG